MKIDYYNRMETIAMLLLCVLSLMSCDRKVADIITIYLDQKDSTRNYYTVIAPREVVRDAYMVLLPGDGLLFGK